MGVSATPIREALLGLERSGWVESEPGRGFTVSPLDPKEIHDLYEVLSELECAALRIAGPPPSAVLADLFNLNVRFRTPGCSADAVALDSEWHSLLIAHCENMRLLDLIRQTRLAAERYERILFDGGVVNVAESADRHARILDALIAGNVEHAIPRLRANLTANVEKLRLSLERRSPSPRRDHGTGEPGR